MLSFGLLHVPRKCGSVVFARAQIMWASGVFKYPENLGVRCFHVHRK